MIIQYNPNIEPLEKELADSGISCIKAIPPHISESHSVYFADPNAFITFLKRENIKTILGASFEISIEDYYIDYEHIKAELGGYAAENLSETLKREIVNYNLSIEQYEGELDGARQNTYFTLYNGFMLYITLADEVNLADPQEQLIKILDTFGADLQREKAEQELLLEKQKAKLKEKILADPAFYQCTNQKLRRAYIDKLIPRLNNEYALIKKQWANLDTGFTFIEARNFIELVWKEYKQ